MFREAEGGGMGKGDPSDLTVGTPLEAPHWRYSDSEKNKHATWGGSKSELLRDKEVAVQ